MPETEIKSINGRPVCDDTAREAIAGKQDALNVSGASAGQYLKVASVDGSGKPISWGTGTPSGGGSGITIHNQLDGRDENGAHPIESISGLAESLGQIEDALLYPTEKTNNMTQPVGKDADGGLWTAPGGGSIDIEVDEADEFAVDSTPTSGSQNLITSGGVYTAIQNAVSGSSGGGQSMPMVTGNLLNLGDSIAYGANFDGSRADTYGKIISEKYGFTMDNYSRSGALLTYRASDASNIKHIKDDVDRAISDKSETVYDYILIDGGTNDLPSSDNNLDNKVGELLTGYDVTNADLSTISGALESIFYKLRTTWPDAKIVYVIVQCMATVPGHQRTLKSQKRFHDAIRAACEKWAIPVADVYAEGQLNGNFTEMAQLYTDGTHPTTAGYTKFYVPLIEKAMR